jgi:hypothetical protein
MVCHHVHTWESPCPRWSYAITQNFEDSMLAACWGYMCMQFLWRALVSSVCATSSHECAVWLNPCSRITGGCCWCCLPHCKECNLISSSWMNSEVDMSVCVLINREWKQIASLTSWRWLLCDVRTDRVKKLTRLSGMFVLRGSCWLSARTRLRSSSTNPRKRANSLSWDFSRHFLLCWYLHFYWENCTDKVSNFPFTISCTQN